jgi:ribosome-associated protein
MTIHVNDAIQIDENELQFEFVRGSGPGGQNVNKVASAVQLRFDVGRSPSLPDDVRARLLAQAGNRITADDVLVLEARQFRNQERNRQDALSRFIALVRQAAVRPKTRRRTQPTAGARERRLDAKRHRSRRKQLRGKVSRHDEGS